MITAKVSWAYGYDIERKAFCYDWGDKNIETEVVGDTKKRVSDRKKFRKFEKKKNAVLSVLYLRMVTLCHFKSDKIVIDK